MLVVTRRQGFYDCMNLPHWGNHAQFLIEASAYLKMIGGFLAAGSIKGFSGPLRRRKS